MLALAWQYLTGRAVAKDITDGTQAEWPPHPDRVFQALVAAWGEHGENPEEAAALAWLCEREPPSISAPVDVQRPAAPKVYVPTNDVEHTRGDYNAKLLALIPERRTRKERFFPSVRTDETVAISWDVDPQAHRAVLERIASRVTYLGHSSSLVRMWVTDQPPPVTWVPVREGSGGWALSVRVPTAGRLDVLRAAFAGGGKGWTRPPFAQEQGYQAAQQQTVVHSPFESRLIILRSLPGDRFGLEQTLQLATALRSTLNKQPPPEAVPQLMGHAADGAPLAENHVAYLPLADVKHIHARGHIMGLALALPRGLTPQLEEAISNSVANAADADGCITLTCGGAGVMKVSVEEPVQRPTALRSETWCAASTSWASVTPVVLDRMPPRRHEDFDGWAAEEISRGCVRQGLPAPLEVNVGHVTAVSGAPVAKSFPPILRKDGQRRWQTHVSVKFPLPVEGPLVLGAGRFRGYGLMRPVQRGGGS